MRPWKVRMKMGDRSNNAILTAGWDSVVRMFNLHEEDIVLFSFHEKYEELQLLVHILA
jgi:hypothetical protein